MFEITLTHDLGVLAVQHEGVLDGTMQGVGQEAGGGPLPPKKLALAIPVINLDAGQETGGGPLPPQKLTIGLPTTSFEVGQGPDGGPIPPPK